MSYIIRWTTAGFAFGGAFIATSFAKITCQHSELGSELGHAEPQHNNSLSAHLDRPLVQP